MMGATELLLANQTVLRQPVNTAEIRAVQQAALLIGVTIKIVAYDDLKVAAADLRRGAAIPVGSVEYIREAMRLGEIPEPENITYPEELRGLLRRKVEQRAAGEVLGTWFVKPVTTKAFTGFVFDTMQDPDTLDEHDREQYDAFMRMEPNERVWVSEPVRFVSEWRYYVLNGRIVGQARYDPDGADDAPQPDKLVVEEAVFAMTKAQSRAPTCGLDFGVFDSGETALVEANDAWALGLYGHAVPVRDYFQMLVTRWQQIHAAGATTLRRQARAARPT